MGAVMSCGMYATLGAQAAPRMTAAFSIPHALVDLQSIHLLRACQSTFERSIRLASAASPNADNDRHSADSVSTPVPPAAVTAGRACLQRLGDTRAIVPFDLPLLLRLAVGVGDDTLVQQVIAHQLELAGTVVRDRGRVLEAAIDVLLHNSWNNEDRHVLTHRTAAHDALAERYAAILDTMRPAGQVLASRLRVISQLASAMAPASWNVDDDLARAREHLRVAMSVPLSAVPAEDTSEVRSSRTPAVVAWLTYLKTPVHANLARWIAVRDSVLHFPPGQTMDSLLNHSAPRLEGDYWFNLPSGTTAPVVPAPGVVSLLVFGSDVTPARAEQLRQLHGRYPALQIVFVSMTPVRRSTDSLRAQPAHDAARIRQRLNEDLRIPGLVCVLEMRYHTDSAATEIPIASPVLDRFHLDPRAYAGHMFLVNAEGVLVNDRPGSILDGKLIQRLLEHK